MQVNSGKAFAITFDRYGGPEVLQYSEVDLPQPGSGQVRVRVIAASVNPFDIKLRRGDFAQQFSVTFPSIPGIDAAGIVDAVGAGAPFAVGDEVLGAAEYGSYAQYAILGAPVKKPPSLRWDEAAVLPTVGEAAVRALSHLRLMAGETVLIHGAGGSVGAIATQLASARNVHVIGSVSESDDERVRAFGATPVRYGEGLAQRVRAAAPDGIHAVLDTAGHGVLPVSIELAGGPERVVTIADMNAAQHGVRFSSGGPNDRVPGALQEIVDLAAAGKLHVAIWRSYPLAQAAQAHADVEAGTNRGKILLVP